MDYQIRPLSIADLPYVEAMQTGIEDDYVKRIYAKLTASESQKLYGLFVGEQLATLAGYSVFASRYAMLGRLRSDRRYRGMDFATLLTEHITREAFLRSGIQWVGANTQEKNAPARRVLEKLGFRPQAMLHGATAKSVSALETGSQPWTEVKDLARKRAWTEMMYVETGAVFPYECYYNFPASRDLFTDADLSEWAFFENSDATRVLIIKTDVKKYRYVHAVYPWADLSAQPGLWETISGVHRERSAETDEETRIWIDLTKENARTLPENHPFELPSPWMLYGMNREQQQTKTAPMKQTSIN